MTDWKSTLADNRFQPLQHYFEPFENDDIIYMSGDDLIDAATVADRPLMSMFVKKVLSPLMNWGPESDLFTMMKDQFCDVCCEAETLNFRGKLVSRQYAPAVPTAVNLDYIQQHLPDHAKQACTVLDVDMLALPVVISSMENCSVINLSYNRVHGVHPDSGHARAVEQAVVDILNLPRILFFVMHTNPFCSTDKQEFFKTLTREQLGKFIFLSPNGEQQLVDDPDLADTVKDAHQRYYFKAVNIVPQD